MDIEGNNNTQVNGDNNKVVNGDSYTENHFHLNKKQENKLNKCETLPATKKVYKRKNIFIDIIAIILLLLNGFLTMIYHTDQYIMFLVILLILSGWYFIDKIFPSLSITIFSHAFHIGNKEIEFESIRRYEYQNNIFYYIFHDDDKEYSLHFYYINQAEYLFYRIHKYAIFNDTKI